MTLAVDVFAAGPIETNAYLVVDVETNRALIIDAPPDVSAPIMTAAVGRGATIEAVIITHPHWDHIGDAAALRARSHAPLIAHPGAVERLAAPGSALMQLPVTVPPSRPDRTIDEGDEVELGAHRFTVMHLPGHEPSHIVLYSEPDRVLLGGDVLFPNGHGRVDIPGADPVAMQQSLARLAVLPPDVRVYPGHGATTTIGDEGWLDALRRTGD
jgi:glyoxylase-like metal-dependent hydrolase (beta-lactamase superfamily II)